MNYQQFENTLGKFIKKLIEDYLKSNNYVRTISATVVSYSAPNAVCYIAGDDIGVTRSYVNKSGEVLVPTDEVELVLKNGTLTNAFIGWKR